MRKFDVQIALEGVREARGKWAKAQTAFAADVEAVMKRLLNEAAANYMSAEEVAQHSGLTVKRVRDLMRSNGLNPKEGKRLLSKKAADALATNAALLGIEPSEFDLMSPLAYLPMGSELRKFLETKRVNLPPIEADEKVMHLAEVFKTAWHEADERGDAGNRTHYGIIAVLREMEANL